MGRIKTQWQYGPYVCSGGNGGSAYVLSYGYDFAGDMISATNGMGTTFTYSYNVAPRLTTLTSSLGDSNHPGTLLSVVHYNAAGALTSATLGNGLAETRSYDQRLRLSSITAGGVYSVAIPSSTGYAPNNDILSANDNVNGNWTYGYDDFNRLSSANATGQAFTYGYDRFGNRWQQNGPHSYLPGFDANNHIVGLGVGYDAAGNTTNDGTTGYAYDAEARIATASNSSSGTSSYVYDGEGRRVQKTVAGNSVSYLYDLAGNQVTEISSTGSWNRGEIYAGTRHLATYPNGTTYFIHSDWLATERLRSTVTGTVYETCTSLPFGDWLTCSGSDPSPIHFTGKERDSESGLDNFGARYDSSAIGRFMSPDAGAFNLVNPQSLNRYLYALNNPLRFIDPDGNYVKDVGTYVLTDYGQITPEVSVVDAALALGMAAGARVEYGPWMKTIGRDQPLGAMRILPAEHPAENTTGAWFAASHEVWSIQVDFRNDPGAGLTASISFEETSKWTISPADNISFRTTNMREVEASNFQFTLSGMHIDELNALLAEAQRQYGKTSDLRYIEIIWALEAEARRREAERRKEEEKKKKKGPVENNSNSFEPD